MIEVLDDKPSSCTDQYRSPSLFQSGVPVWCTSGDSRENIKKAVNVFTARQRTALITDVKSATHQLTQLFNANGTAFLSIGGSPKLVKWLLKKQGFQVVTINVSTVSDKVTRSAEFEEYLERKLTKCGSATTFVLIDFADTGVSLYRLKRDVQDLRPNANVETVAIGKSEKLDKRENQIYKNDLRLIVTGIPTLQDDLDKQRLKNSVVGRNKVKNPYATWSKSNVEFDQSRMVGTSKTFHKHFQKVKSYFPEALAAPLLSGSDLAEICESASNAVSKDEDENEYIW